jgi:O-antigen/teichoic acid export membrane protein
MKESYSVGTGWISKGFWATMDQGFFASSNFLLNLGLARWLPPRDYGVFTLAFSVFLLVSTVYTGFVTEPMLVFGSGRYRAVQRGYLSFVASAHWGFVAFTSFLMLLAGLVLRHLGDDALSSALWALSVASPFILLQWLVRRACYVYRRPHLAAWGGLLYLVLMVAGLSSLLSLHLLSAVSALGLMGVSSLLTDAWLALHLRFIARLRIRYAFVREAALSHLGYGRWAAATMFLALVQSNVYYAFLPIAIGLSATAVLQAFMNLILPVRYVTAALTTLLIPSLSRLRGSVEFERRMQVALLLLTTGTIVYCLLLMSTQDVLVPTLYGDKYLPNMKLIGLLSLFLLAIGLADVLAAALRALEQPRQIFGALALAAACTLTFGMWFTVAWGIIGAGLGLALSSLAETAVLLGCYGRSVRLRRRVSEYASTTGHQGIGPVPEVTVAAMGSHHEP